MPTSIEVLQKYPNAVFVETGTHCGDGVQRALNAGFHRVISIELNKELYEMAYNRFLHDSRVKIVYGSSSKDLYDVIKGVKERITFFLDAHYSGLGTSFDTSYCPLYSEITQISKHYRNDHTILIDDRRLLGMIPTEEQKITYSEVNEEELKLRLLKVNSSYKFRYEDGHVKDDVIVAYLDISFLVESHVDLKK